MIFRETPLLFTFPYKYILGELFKGTFLTLFTDLKQYYHLFSERQKFVIMRAFSNLLLLLSCFQSSFGVVSIQVDYADALDSENSVNCDDFEDLSGSWKLNQKLGEISAKMFKNFDNTAVDSEIPYTLTVTDRAYLRCAVEPGPCRSDLWQIAFWPVGYCSPSPVPVRISLKNEVLKQYPFLAGDYQISSLDQNGIDKNSIWKKDSYSIWYNSRFSKWFIGDLEFSENTGYISASNDDFAGVFGSLTSNTRNRLPYAGVAEYWRNESGWTSPSPNDIRITQIVGKFGSFHRPYIE
jgi:hypothetical protein